MKDLLKLFSSLRKAGSRSLGRYPEMSVVSRPQPSPRERLRAGATDTSGNQSGETTRDEKWELTVCRWLVSLARGSCRIYTRSYSQANNGLQQYSGHPFHLSTSSCTSHLRIVTFGKILLVPRHVTVISHKCFRKLMIQRTRFQRLLLLITYFFVAFVQMRSSLQTEFLLLLTLLCFPVSDLLSLINGFTYWFLKMNSGTFVDVFADTPQNERANKREELMWYHIVFISSELISTFYKYYCIIGRLDKSLPSCVVYGRGWFLQS